jgi:uncharacterized membrane protein YfcA
LPKEHGLLNLLMLPSILGGFLGAWVLAITPNWLFARIVPFLVLFATLLFANRKRFSRRVGFLSKEAEHTSTGGKIWGFFFQLFVATYGGYFGAGIGILMLASLGVMGLRDIHRMNALKTVLSTVINGVALVYFIAKGLVVWSIALLMAAGAIAGGYIGARMAKQVNQKYLQALIVAVGLFVSVWLFFR